MHLLAGPFFACSLLLAAAGALKAVRPGTTALALRSVGVPAPQLAVRAGGAAEAAIGVVAIAVGGRVLALAVAASYAAFALFVVVAMRRGGVVSSCGCFGRPDTPPTRIHVAVNVIAAAVALGAAAGSQSAVTDVVREQPLGGVPFLLITAMCGWLAYAVLAILPTVRSPRAAA